jgi:cell division protein FtsB
VITSFLERGLPAVILLVAAVGAPVMILSSEGLPRLRSLEKELAMVNHENGEQRRQIEFLRKTVSNLKDNPSAVERIARDELGLVRKNEVVFQFPPARGGS